AGTLSGGEQQMLAFGRAMMAQPKLLMLDEPSLGLAPLMVDEVMRSIRVFRDSGVTVFLVEQNANLALRLADRAYAWRRARSPSTAAERSSWPTNAYGRAISARKHHRTKELHKRSECTCQAQLCANNDVRISSMRACTASPENDHDHEPTQISRRRSGRRGARRNEPGGLGAIAGADQDRRLRADVGSCRSTG